MAKNMFGEILNKTSDVTNKLKDSVITTMANNNDNKKKLKELSIEQEKFLKFLGIEVYDRYKNGKGKIDELETYYQQIEELDKQIDVIKKSMEVVNASNDNEIMCECGTKIKKTDKFCPNCGKKNELDEIICECGSKIKRNVKFCSTCGMKIEKLLQTESVKTVTYKCVCGAEVSKDDVICMECGRRVDII